MSREQRQRSAPVRFGIIGCGTVGPTHAGALAQLAARGRAELVAVADVVRERAEAVAKKFDVPRVYGHFNELIADDGVEAVCVCTPSGLHAEPAVAALRAGKHAVVEKPMEVTLAAC